MGADLYKRLVDKSIEAFILGFEIYNKPTIKYRVEGFSFFLINAWELMLKAKLIKDGTSIYFTDDPSRTISVSRAVALVYTDKNQPLRLNLEKIITLRNTSTHFITEDYETVYAPLFQSNVLSFCEQANRFHGVDIREHLSANFLTLSATIAPLTNEQIKIKYPPEVAQRLIFQKNDIDITTKLHESDGFAIAIKHNLYHVKSKDNADFTFKLAADGDTPIQTITKYKNAGDTHKLTFGNLAKDIDNRLKKKSILFRYSNNSGEKKTFNMYTLRLFVNFYEMKRNEKYAYSHVIGNKVMWTYSQQAAEFIVDEVSKDPHGIIDKLVQALDKEKKITPGT